MDNRTFLKAGTCLDFPGMSCVIEGTEGFGSNGVVYRGWYRDRVHKEKKHYVLIKELFPFHPKGHICRAGDGSVRYGDEGAKTFALQEKSFRNGNRVHLTLLEKFPHQIGANLNTYELNNTLYTVLGISGGRSLDSQLDAFGKEPLEVIVKRFLCILDSLEVFHKEGYLHLDISPDNILLIGSGEQERSILIDYNSVLEIRELSLGKSDVYYSIKKGYTAPEVKLHYQHKIGTESDIYSLTAVFYRHLTGEALTETQQLRRTPPDVSGCEILKQQPETVKYLVRRILAKGLAILPEKRYHSTEEIRAEFQTLLELINGTGIHHWALWEDGRKRVRKMISENPSYDYMNEALYPVMTLSETGEYLSVNDLAQKIMCGEKDSCILTGGGGTGKTTALLNIIFSREERYSPEQTAMLYLPLYSFREENGNYIRNRILENLKFRSDTSTFEAARHQLELLLSSDTSADKPKLLLLLDGYNEIFGDTTSLLSEIRELSAWGGVKFIITSRVAVPETDFSTVSLSHLREEDVKRELSSRGLLLPESEEMVQALKTPMMLAMFISAAQESQGQVLVSDEKELLDRYYSSLFEKQISMLPQNHPDRWAIDGAMQLVLPMLAYRTQQKKSVLTEKELASVVKSCYKLISSKITFSAFPQWMGHRREVLSGTKHFEDWLGIVIYDILWSRTGLLIREGNNYRIFHQRMCEYLSEKYAVLRKRIRKYRNRKKFFTTASVALSLTACFGSALALFPDVMGQSVFVRLYAVDEKDAEDIVDYGAGAYTRHGQMYKVMKESLSADKDEFERLKNKLLLYTDNSAEVQAKLAVIKAKRLFSHYAVMPWSYKKPDVDYYEKLVNRPVETKEDYYNCLTCLEYALQNGDLEYVKVLEEYLDADADLTAAIYQYACMPHISAMESDSPVQRSALKSAATCAELEARRALLKEPVTLQDIANCEQNVKDCKIKLKEFEGKYHIMKRQ